MPLKRGAFAEPDAETGSPLSLRPIATTAPVTTIAAAAIATTATWKRRPLRFPLV
jgi:hypothetical protein